MCYFYLIFDRLVMIFNNYSNFILSQSSSLHSVYMETWMPN